jgi:hypothetical protein
MLRNLGLQSCSATDEGCNPDQQWQTPEVGAENVWRGRVFQL